LEGAGEEFELDVVVAQVLGDGQQLGGAAPEALHLVDGEDDPLVRDGLLDGAGEVHRLDELRPYLDRVLIFSEKTGSHPASSRASSWLWSFCWAVLQRAYPTQFGELGHVAEPIARGIVRKLFCERL
jgi:hypothetical protein